MKSAVHEAGVFGPVWSFWFRWLGKNRPGSTTLLMLQDLQIRKAVAAIPQRSERQLDSNKLQASFVDVGLVPQLETINNQIAFGRRGTGKTHVLKILESNVRKDPTAVALYIDARSLGSSAQFLDCSLPMQQRCTSLFRDFLAEINNALLQYVVEHESEHTAYLLQQLSDFASAATKPTVTETEATITARQKSSQSDAANLTLDIAPAPKASAAISSGSTRELETTRSGTISLEDKIIFPDVTSSLTATLSKGGLSLWILLDEWSSLPRDIQPYLAELIKRTLLPNSRIYIKIAALEYRSNFGIRRERGQFTGFELGGDLSASLDLDDYYVFDRNPEQLTDAFEELLYLHLKSELPEDYLASTLGVCAAKDLTRSLFTDREVFQELVRASEGIARDLINIFTVAFFSALKQARTKIDKRTVVEAARQWYEQDKQQGLSEELHSILGRIMGEVIGKKRTRSFMVERRLERNEHLQGLFDARVIHLVRRGYADKENPGVRYNIYTLDYGTYVDLLATKSAPDGFMDSASEVQDPDLIVPFDDKRSIRRVILGDEILQISKQGELSL